MQNSRVTKDWLPLQPFYRCLDENLKIIALDIPMTQSPTPFNGVEICGWLTHDVIGFHNEGEPISYPNNIIVDFEKKLSLSPVKIKSERWGLQKVSSLLNMRDELIHATYKLGDLSKSLIIKNDWDLFILSLAGPHRGGHKLWDLSGTYGPISESERLDFSNALKDIYIACDQVIGELINSVKNNTNILVFSLHGMGSNTSRSYLLPKIFPHILSKTCKKGPHINQRPLSIFDTFKNFIPNLIRSIGPDNNSFPFKIINNFRRESEKNTANENNSDPAFLLRTDLNGYIRINLQGREKRGIIEHGKNYDFLCSAISKELLTLTDVDTRTPIVNEIFRADELYASTSRLDYLPDLIVTWVSRPSITERKITFGKKNPIILSANSRNMDGRSGNHRDEGFLLLVGPKIKKYSKIDNGKIVDLVPTIYDLLGVQKPNHLKGNSLCI